LLKAQLQASLTDKVIQMKLYIVYEQKICIKKDNPIYMFISLEATTLVVDVV